MKRGLGYKTIMEKWVELQQGYELEEGMRKLEVKDISDLNEIWCFIKVKNIVQDTLRDLGKQVRQVVKGCEVTRDFITQLIYGGTMSFINTDNIELACVSYNAEVEKAESMERSAIIGTDTLTTVQRPDSLINKGKATKRPHFEII